MFFPVHTCPRIDIFSQHKTATDKDLRREFETYGAVERVRIVRDKQGRSRGYAFVIFERERDMKGTAHNRSSVSARHPRILITAPFILPFYPTPPFADRVDPRAPQPRTRTRTASSSSASA